MNKVKLFIEKYRHADERSRETIKNIILSLGTRAANILAHLLVVPLTINYLNPTRYGIWLTLSSIIGWVAFFDLGLSNGFRNRFAEAKAKGDIDLARQYVSTTYAVIGMIVSALLLIVILLNYTILDWSSILHVDPAYKDELTFVFAVVIIFTCMSMVVNIFASMLNADQKVGYASIIQAVGQYLSLLVIYILSKTTEGNLSSLALYYSGVPCLFMLLVSIVMFSASRYRIYSPKFTHVKLSLTRKIMNLGMQFFAIQMCMLAVFQIVNIVISRELGPEAVTQYNIANKYFNVLYMTATIIITPFWSAFTDAYTKQDYSWMNKAYKKLFLLVLATLCGYALMVVVAPFMYKIWIGNSVTISLNVTLSMAFFAFCQTYCAVNSYIINGIGAVRIQTLVYVVFALTAWNSLVFSSNFGIEGVITYTGLVYLVISLFEQIQINKILKRQAKGIWIK